MANKSFQQIKHCEIDPETIKCKKMTSDSHVKQEEKKECIIKVREAFSSQESSIS